MPDRFAVDRIPTRNTGALVRHDRQSGGFQEMLVRRNIAFGRQTNVGPSQGKRIMATDNVTDAHVGGRNVSGHLEAHVQGIHHTKGRRLEFHANRIFGQGTKDKKRIVVGINHQAVRPRAATGRRSQNDGYVRTHVSAGAQQGFIRGNHVTKQVKTQFSRGDGAGIGKTARRYHGNQGRCQSRIGIHRKRTITSIVNSGKSERF